MMSRSEQSDVRPVPVALTPQLPPRAHRPLCMSVSSNSSGRFKALETQEWKNNLKAQVRSNAFAAELLLCPQETDRAKQVSVQENYMKAFLFFLIMATVNFVPCLLEKVIVSLYHLEAARKSSVIWMES